MNSISPRLQVVKVSLFENLDCLLVYFRALLEYPPDLTDVKDLVVEDVLLLQEIQDVIGSSVVQNVL